MTRRDHVRSIVRVLEHHALVYRRTWRGTVFSTFLTPILYLGLHLRSQFKIKSGKWPKDY